MRIARFYEINGQLYPSVTTALSIINKPRLGKWRGDLGNEEADRVMREAADIGSAVHDLCYQVNTGVYGVSFPVEYADIMGAYEAWFKSTIKEVVQAEMLVYSHRYQYAGRLDLLAIIKGDRHPTVIDIKTSKDIYPDMALQLAGYQQALNEMGIKANRRLVVHLDKIIKGKSKTKEYRNHERDLRMFLYALELYRYFRGGNENATTGIVRV